jgi:hypothetical protein
MEYTGMSAAISRRLMVGAAWRVSREAGVGDVYLEEMNISINFLFTN